MGKTLPELRCRARSPRHCSLSRAVPPECRVPCSAHPGSHPDPRNPSASPTGDCPFPCAGVRAPPLLGVRAVSGHWPTADAAPPLCPKNDQLLPTTDTEGILPKARGGMPLFITVPHRDLPIDDTTTLRAMAHRGILAPMVRVRTRDGAGGHCRRWHHGTCLASRLPPTCNIGAVVSISQVGTRLHTTGVASPSSATAAAHGAGTRRPYGISHRRRFS